MQRFWLLTLVLITLSDPAKAETWSERLGYPPDKRVLILYGNYMGEAHEFNRCGQNLLGKGFLQSAGVMPPCPWFEDFAAWCREYPEHDIGICLTLNSPGNGYRWGPVGRDAETSSLIEPSAYLWRNELQFALRANAGQVQHEIDQQISKARRAGIRPSHLNVFWGPLLIRPDLLSIYLQTAERNWLPAAMVEMTPEIRVYLQTVTQSRWRW